MTTFSVPTRLTLAAVLGTGLLAAAPARAALVLFDDFTSSAINPSRWAGEESKQYGSSRLEARRAVATGQLRIETKGTSDNSSNSGSGSVRNSVIFAKSASITDMRATITMRTVAPTACAANATASSVRARLFGFFFNAGSPTPGSEYNDVYAGVQVYRMSNSTDPAGVMRVSGFSGICTDDSCIGSSPVGTSVDLGTVNLNAAVAVEVQWDAANNRFAFQRDASAFQYIPYTLSDTQPPEYEAKRMEVSNIVANCVSVRTSVSGGADFDNVYTNALPANLVQALRQPLQAVPEIDSEFGYPN